MVVWTSLFQLLTVRAFSRTDDSFRRLIRPPSVSFLQQVKLRVWCMVYGSWWDMKYGTWYKGILKLGWACMSFFRRCAGFLCFVCTGPASIATGWILFCCFNDTPQSIALCFLLVCWLSFHLGQLNTIASLQLMVASVRVLFKSSRAPIILDSEGKET